MTIEELIAQARELKKEMSWNELAEFYNINRHTLMYHLMPEEKKASKRADMRENNKMKYWAYREHTKRTKNNA